jgi:hypothetical protein
MFLKELGLRLFLPGAPVAGSSIRLGEMIHPSFSPGRQETK